MLSRTHLVLPLVTIPSGERQEEFLATMANAFVATIPRDALIRKYARSPDVLRRGEEISRSDARVVFVVYPERFLWQPPTTKPGAGRPSIIAGMSSSPKPPS